jgi:CubicO group peptidase (beta-lactamase class C family)
MKKLAILFALVSTCAISQTVMPMKNGQFFMPDEWLMSSGQPYHYRIPASNSGMQMYNREPSNSEKEVVERANTYLERSESKVILLGDGNKIVHLKFKPPANIDKLYLSASVDKTITALSAGVAVCDNKLALKTKAEDMIPQLRGTDLGKSTLEDNLKMASGSVTSFNDSQSETAEEQASRMSGKTNFMDLISGRLSKAREKMFGKKVQPGELFDYKSQDPLLVGMMISAAYGLEGKNLRSWQEKNFWTKVRTNDRIIQGEDLSGYAQSDGNTRLTINDWARLANFVIESRKETGCYGNFVRSATTTQIKTDNRFAKMYNGYGYFTWTDNTQLPGSFTASGYGGQSITWNTKNDKYVIVFSNQGDLTGVHKIADAWFNAK